MGSGGHEPGLGSWGGKWVSSCSEGLLGLSPEALARLLSPRPFNSDFEFTKDESMFILRKFIRFFYRLINISSKIIKRFTIIFFIKDNHN